MTDKPLDIMYNEVSVEFSNPFAKIGQFTKSKLKSFFKSANDVSDKAFNSVELNHPNGLFRQNTAIQQKIDAKKVQYMDFMPLTVFVPSYLRDDVHFDRYLNLLVLQMRLAKAITVHAATDVEAIFDGYIGNPSRLTDPNLVMPNADSGYDVISLMRQYDALSNDLSKMIVADGSKSTRKFSDTFARVGDWKMACSYATEINAIFCDLARNFDRIKRTHADVTARVNKLIMLIDRDSRYVVSAEVGGYLSDTIYRYAKLTEFVGASMYAAQVSLKAMTDTSIAITRATS